MSIDPDSTDYLKNKKRGYKSQKPDEEDCSEGHRLYQAGHEHGKTEGKIELLNELIEEAEE